MSTDQKQPIAIEAMCFDCNKIWNISLLPEDAKGVRCVNCGGFVVTESGKAMTRYVYDEWLATSPLLGEHDYENYVKDMLSGGKSGSEEPEEKGGEKE